MLLHCRQQVHEAAGMRFIAHADAAACMAPRGYRPPSLSGGHEGHQRKAAERIAIFRR